jgi:nitroreductase
MEVREALRRHRMTRAFDGTAVDEERLVALCEEALRAPTAGHARGVTLGVLAGPEGARRYLETATDPEWRESSSRSTGLALAGGAVLVTCDPATYATRYAEADKSGGLDDAAAWPVPYWYGDAAFATMSLLLLAESDGLASCFLGAFRHEPELLALARAPRGARVFGAVLVGRAAPGERRSASLDRPGPTRAARVVRLSG